MFLGHHMIKPKRNNESGRTMVEMFSVVIVVSILTAIGLRGYSYARSRYYANQTIQAVLQEGAQLLTNRKLRKVAKNTTLTSAEIERALPPQANYEITKTEKDEYTITITGLSVEACEMATKTKAIRMTADGGTCNTGTAVFTFSNLLNKESIVE